MAVCRPTGCDNVGFQETIRDGQNWLTAAGYAGYCSGDGGYVAGGKGQQRVGLAIKKSILRTVCGEV